MANPGFMLLLMAGISLEITSHTLKNPELITESPGFRKFKK